MGVRTSPRGVTTSPGVSPPPPVPPMGPSAVPNPPRTRAHRSTPGVGATLGAGDTVPRRVPQRPYNPATCPPPISRVSSTPCAGRACRPGAPQRLAPPSTRRAAWPSWPAGCAATCCCWGASPWRWPSPRWGHFLVFGEGGVTWVATPPRSWRWDGVGLRAPVPAPGRWGGFLGAVVAPRWRHGDAVVTPVTLWPRSWWASCWPGCSSGR